MNLDPAWFEEHWELKLAFLSITIGLLSVMWLFRAPKVVESSKPAKSAKAKSTLAQPPSQSSAVATSQAANSAANQQQGKSIATLLKSQGKRKGVVAPTHPLFRRLFKASGNGDVTCFAASPDGRVRDLWIVSQ
jgi:hypothetical protein